MSHVAENYHEGWIVCISRSVSLIASAASRNEWPFARMTQESAIGALPTGRQPVKRGGSFSKQLPIAGVPERDELREQPHGFRLARLALGEQPERAVEVQGGARHAEPLAAAASGASASMLRRARGRWASRSRAPIRDAVIGPDDSAHAVGAPRGKQVARQGKAPISSVRSVRADWAAERCGRRRRREQRRPSRDHHPHGSPKLKNDPLLALAAKPPRTGQ